MERKAPPSVLLRVAAIAVLFGTFLPLGGRGAALWPWQLAFDPSFVVATLVSVLCAATLYALARRMPEGPPGSTTALLLLLFALAVALLGQADSSAALGGQRAYNLGPLALSVALIAGADASASTLHPRRLLAARVAAMLGLLGLMAFLASPTAYGTVVAEMSSQLRYALEVGLTMQERITATISEVLVVGLVAASVFVATGVLHGRPHGFERVAILLSALALLVLADSARGTLDDGWLGFLTALRAVSAWLTLATVAVAATIAVIGRMSIERAIPRSRLPLSAGVVAAVALVSLLVPHSPQSEPWRLDRAPAWANALYQDAVPALAGARDRDERRAAARIVLALAEANPELQRAWERLVPLLDDPGFNRKAIARRARDINEKARDAKLPFYLDVDVALLGAGESAFWNLELNAYRIQESRSARMASLDLSTLWVESTQERASVHQGFSGPEEVYGVVILDEVRRNWDRQLAPSLLGTDTSYYTSYGQYAKVLREALEATVVERAPSAWRADASTAFDRYLVCLAGQHTGQSSRLAERYCPALVAEVEPLIIEALAQNVERHELQHMVDDQRGGARVPDAVRNTLRGYGTASLERTSAELSAYLAEIADGPLPHLSLAHLVAVATSRPSSPEAAAGEVARWLLSDDGTWDSPFAMSADALRDRASFAFFQLFGREVPRLEIERA